MMNNFELIFKKENDCKNKDNCYRCIFLHKCFKDYSEFIQEAYDSE